MSIEAEPSANPVPGEVVLNFNWQPAEEHFDVGLTLDVHTTSRELKIDPYGASSANLHTSVFSLEHKIAEADINIDRASVGKIQTQFENHSTLAPDTKARVALKDYISTLHTRENDTAEQEAGRLRRVFNRIGGVAAAGVATVGLVTGYEIGTGHVGNEFSITLLGILTAAGAFIYGQDRFPINARLIFKHGVSQGAETGRAKFVLDVLEQKTVDSTEPTTEPA